MKIGVLNMDRIQAMVNIITETYAKMQGLGVALQGIMIDHDSLMSLKGEAVNTAHLVDDPKYRTKRLRLAGVGVTAGDSTRQAP